jgi:hypothetical protein
MLTGASRGTHRTPRAPSLETPRRPRVTADAEVPGTFVTALQEAVARGARIAGLCTGAFALAAGRDPAFSSAARRVRGTGESWSSVR